MSLIQYIRALHNDNGTLIDHSLAATGSDTMALPIIAAEDQLIIGQSFPFNNFYMEVNTVSATTSAISAVDYWTGNNWEVGVDILDETSVGGVSVARSGTVRFSPDRLIGRWDSILDTGETNAPPELSGTRIYNMYWIRIKWDSDLSPGTILDRISYRFASNEQLSGIDSGINEYLDAWSSGKTNWNEQLLLGSDHLVFDMKARGLLQHPGQLLRHEDISFATAYRTLALIYARLGEGFEAQRVAALDEYNGILSSQVFTIDVDGDGVTDEAEISKSHGRLVR